MRPTMLTHMLNPAAKAITSRTGGMLPQTAVGVGAKSSAGKPTDTRRIVGEFVGGVFYGTLMKQMQMSKFKTKYMDGGRGEEVFQGQMGQELAKRLGRSLSEPVANKITATIDRRLKKEGRLPEATPEGRA